MDELKILRFARLTSMNYVVIEGQIIPYVTVGEALKFLGGK